MNDPTDHLATLRRMADPNQPDKGLIYWQVRAAAWALQEIERLQGENRRLESELDSSQCSLNMLRTAIDSVSREEQP